MTATTTSTNTKTRRNEWFALTACTTIALVAFAGDMDGNMDEQDEQEKWSIWCLLLVLVIAGVGFFAHVLGTLFVGTLVEGFLVSQKKNHNPSFVRKLANMLSRLC